MLNRKVNSLLIIWLAVIVWSCGAERKLARAYIKHHKSEGVMISPSNFLYKDNPGARLDIKRFPSETQQDSIAYFTSNYVQYISDSIFLTRFTNSLIDELVDYGYHVMLDESADEFLSCDNPSWIIQLSQLQLEENYTPRYAYGYDYDDQEYYQEYRQNSIALNSWLDVSKVNSEKGVKQLLFLSGYIEDNPNQEVSLEYYDGQFYFYDSRDTISMNDIYRMATASGKKHAELLFDYFMNDYIRTSLPKTVSNRKELHYNRIFNTIEVGLNERFDLVR